MKLHMISMAFSHQDAQNISVQGISFQNYFLKGYAKVLVVFRHLKNSNLNSMPSLPPSSSLNGVNFCKCRLISDFLFFQFFFLTGAGMVPNSIDFLARDGLRSNRKDTTYLPLVLLFCDRSFAGVGWSFKNLSD